MPPIRHAPNHTQLIAPYPDQGIGSTNQQAKVADISYVLNAEGDKENQAPNSKQKPPKAKTTTKSATKESTNDDNERSDLPASYLDIPLEEIKGEVPIYENAAAIRRKLNKLIESKTKIPGSTKTFNKTTMSKEICAVADRHHAIKTHQGMESTGPSVQALTRFLKQSGGMAGGDSKTYYFGNMLLEKLRIWNGEKKTPARVKAEKEFPMGRERCDPNHVWLTLMKGEPGPSYGELANCGRMV